MKTRLFLPNGDQLVPDRDMPELNDLVVGDRVADHGRTYRVKEIDIEDGDRELHLIPDLAAIDSGPTLEMCRDKFAHVAAMPDCPTSLGNVWIGMTTPTTPDSEPQIFTPSNVWRGMLGVPAPEQWALHMRALAATLPDMEVVMRGNMLRAKTECSVLELVTIGVLDREIARRAGLKPEPQREPYDGMTHGVQESIDWIAIRSASLVGLQATLATILAIDFEGAAEAIAVGVRDLQRQIARVDAWIPGQPPRGPLDVEASVEVRRLERELVRLTKLINDWRATHAPNE